MSGFLTPLGFSNSVEGADLLVVEDILDPGRTLELLQERLRALGRFFRELVDPPGRAQRPAQPLAWKNTDRLCG